MQEKEIFDHWTMWAKSYGEDVRATTRAPFAKELEISALIRYLEPRIRQNPQSRLLEAGCGNGANCTALAQHFPSILVDGFDYVPEMIDSARAQLSKMSNNVQSRTNYFVGDIKRASDVVDVNAHYDFVFTNRCVINLPTPELQQEALLQLCKIVRPGSSLLLLENFQTTFNTQNRLRTAMHLPPREVASFNLFLEEARVQDLLDSEGLILEETIDVSSLHDLLTYVLIPATNGGFVDYSHPVIEAAKRLMVQDNTRIAEHVQGVGQNRLFCFTRPLLTGDDEH